MLEITIGKENKIVNVNVENILRSSDTIKQISNYLLESSNGTIKTIKEQQLKDFLPIQKAAYTLLKKATDLYNELYDGIKQVLDNQNYIQQIKAQIEQQPHYSSVLDLVKRTSLFENFLIKVMDETKGLIVLAESFSSSCKYLLGIESELIYSTIEEKQGFMIPILYSTTIEDALKEKILTKPQIGSGVETSIQDIANQVKLQDHLTQMAAINLNMIFNEIYTNRFLKHPIKNNSSHLILWNMSAFWEGAQVTNKGVLTQGYARAVFGKIALKLPQYKNGTPPEWDIKNFMELAIFPSDSEAGALADDIEYGGSGYAIKALGASAPSIKPTLQVANL